MVRRKSKILTEVEAEIMQVLWKSGASSVQEIADKLVNNPAYNTVATMLKVLERKGYVSHKKEGRQYLYSPLKDESKVKGSIISYVVRKFFSGSAKALFNHLIQQENLSKEQLLELKELIEKKTIEHNPVDNS